MFYFHLTRSFEQHYVANAGSLVKTSEQLLTQKTDKFVFKKHAELTEVGYFNLRRGVAPSNIPNTPL